MTTHAIPPEALPVLREIERGMELKKCRKCGCMQDALDGAAQAFGGSDALEIQGLLPTIDRYRARMEAIAYDCIGCKKCWGADAAIQLGEHFEDAAQDSWGKSCGSKETDAPVSRLKNAAEILWPPYPGDYLVGNPSGTVAICTLSSRELPTVLMGQTDPNVAIAGRCDTENIGVEKVVLNILANPSVRWLVLCGVEAQGHRTGDAFLHLKEHGVNANMRVLESASWRPVLKNLTLLDVARFREQVQLINLVGTSDVSAILSAVAKAAATPLPPLSDYAKTTSLSFERIQARAPERLKLDRSGFFIVIPRLETGLIVCEHYENNGRLTHVIEGKQAALIAATAVERGLVTQLDHAAYLGRELMKAELSVKTGAEYEQDAALGSLTVPPVSALEPDTCEDTPGCACHS